MEIYVLAARGGGVFFLLMKNAHEKKWPERVILGESHLKGAKLGGGNSNIFYVHPENWGNDPI